MQIHIDIAHTSSDQDTETAPIANPDQARLASMASRDAASNSLGALGTSEALIPQQVSRMGVYFN